MTASLAPLTAELYANLDGHDGLMDDAVSLAELIVDVFVLPAQEATDASNGFAGDIWLLSRQALPKYAAMPMR